MAIDPKNSIRTWLSDGSGLTLSIRWDPSFAPGWEGRLLRAQTILDQEVLRRTDPYVPIKSGALKSSALLASHIGGGELVYATPYAAWQYYNTSDSRTYDPLRGAHWFQRMRADHLDALLRVAKKAVSSP